MDPRIQYAKTADGVSIAYWTLGEGQALVEMPALPFSHLQLELQVPLWRAWDERLAERRAHVRYDPRGTGMSDRNVVDFSFEGLLLDLEAVVDRLGLEKFALFGHHYTGAVAVAYAARHPDRVSHLILWCSYARGASFMATPQVKALRALMDQDWETYIETMAHTAVGWSEGEEAHRLAALMRECVTPEVARNLPSECDVTDLLPNVQAPTLVLQRRGYPLVPVENARELASRIPNAQLALLEGTSGATYLDNMEAVLGAIDEFLGDGERTAAVPPAPASDLRTILFTDIESSTALTQRLGDAAAQELVRAHNTIVRDALTACGGSEIKHTGDGIMASFPSASRAIECAIAIQRAVAANDDTPLRVRIGLNAGEPVAEEHDLFGTAVQLARRVCDHAAAGQILVSDVVRQLAAGKGFLFSDVGDVVPKGFNDAVRLYEVRWREEER